MKAKNKLKHGDKTKIEILKAGCKLWHKSPEKVKAYIIAETVGLTHNGVRYHFSSPLKLRDAVAEYAVQIGDSKVIAQLIATGHKAVSKLTEAQKKQHLKKV